MLPCARCLYLSLHTMLGYHKDAIVFHFSICVFSHSSNPEELWHDSFMQWRKRRQQILHKISSKHLWQWSVFVKTENYCQKTAVRNGQLNPSSVLSNTGVYEALNIEDGWMDGWNSANPHLEQNCWVKHISKETYSKNNKTMWCENITCLDCGANGTWLLPQCKINE